MATFDVTQFIDRPSVEGLEVCKKNDLYLIAQHYDISISKTQRKAEIKACVISALLDKGVFPAIEILPTEAAESVGDAAGGSFSRVPVGDRATPVTVAGGEVGLSFSMPKFRLDLRVKIRLARLQLDAQARQEDLRHQIEMYRIDADTKVRLRQLELQAAQDPPKTISKTSICLEDGPEIAAGPSNLSIVSNDSASADRSVVVAPTHFDMAKNIAIVPPFREKEVEAYFQAF